MAAGEACKDWGICECVHSSIPKDSTLTNGKPFVTLTSQRRGALFLRPRYPTAGVAEGNPTTLPSYTLGGDGRAGRLESGRHGGATPGTKTGRGNNAQCVAAKRRGKEASDGQRGSIVNQRLPAGTVRPLSVITQLARCPLFPDIEVYRRCGVIYFLT